MRRIVAAQLGSRRARDRGRWAGRPAAGQDRGGPYHRPEAIEMIAGILDGTAMQGQGHGWFHAGQTRYGWDWLAAGRDANRDGAVTRSSWPAPTATSPGSTGTTTGRSGPTTSTGPRTRFTSARGNTSATISGEIDADRDGRVTQPEWDGFFARISDGKDHLTVDDFREAWTSPRPRSPPPSPASLRRPARARRRVGDQADLDHRPGPERDRLGLRRPGARRGRPRLHPGHPRRVASGSP